MFLCCLPAMAQLNGSGYYRIYNVQNQTHYLTIANDLFNYATCISTAGGGLTSVWLGGKGRVLECAGKYLQTDIHMVNDQDFTHPAALIYADKYLPNQASNHKYNLIGQGTSILTLTTGTYPGNIILEFQDIYVTIDPVSGTNNQYTASVYLKSESSSMADLGTRYFVDDNGTFAINTSSSATNAKWVIVPATYFNVVPEVEFNGKHYTTLKVPFACQLSGSIEKAYVISAITADGVLTPEPIAVTGDTIPAGTPVVLECSSDNAADCRLIPMGKPRFTTPDVSVQHSATVNSPRADNGTNYNGTNLLEGTYFANTDGAMVFTTKTGTSSFNANNYTKPTDPQKYVLGITESGKLGFVPATGTAMPANTAWLLTAAEFPWQLPGTVMLGDVDDDGEVTINDVSVLIDYLLGNEVETFNAVNANVNEDEDISIADISDLIDMLLNAPPAQ